MSESEYIHSYMIHNVDDESYMSLNIVQTIGDVQTKKRFSASKPTIRDEPTDAVSNHKRVDFLNQFQGIYKTKYFKKTPT